MAAHSNPPCNKKTSQLTELVKTLLASFGTYFFVQKFSNLESPAHTNYICARQELEISTRNLVFRDYLLYYWYSSSLVAIIKTQLS